MGAAPPGNVQPGTAQSGSVRDRVFESAPGQLIYERLLRGTEHSVGGFVYKGRVTVVGITDKSTTPDYRLETAHDFPSALAPEAAAAVEQLTREVVTELGLDACAIHLECFVEPDDKARLVEVAARVGGDYITSYLVPAATGRNFYADVLRVVTGQQPEPYPNSYIRVAAVRKIMTPTEGIFTGISPAAFAAALPADTALEWILERKPGEPALLPPRDFMSGFLAILLGSNPVKTGIPQEIAEARAALNSTLEAVLASLTPSITASITPKTAEA